MLKNSQNDSPAYFSVLTLKINEKKLNLFISIRVHPYIQIKSMKRGMVRFPTNRSYLGSVHLTWRGFLLFFCEQIWWEHILSLTWACRNNLVPYMIHDTKLVSLARLKKVKECENIKCTYKILTHRNQHDKQQ